MDEKRLTVLKDIMAMNTGRETIYEEEDIKEIRNCFANKMFLYGGYSSVACFLVSNFYPFQAGKTSLILKRFGLTTGLWLVTIPFISSLVRIKCLDGNVSHLRLKPQYTEEMKPVAEEVKTLPPASFESELSNNFSYDQSSFPSSIHSFDFQNLSSKDNIEQSNDTDTTSTKKFITYDDLRKLNSGRKDDSSAVSSSPEMSEPRKKAKNIYGDIIEW